MGLSHRRIGNGIPAALIGIVLNLGSGIFLGLFRFLVAWRPTERERHDVGNSLVNPIDTSAVLRRAEDRGRRIIAQLYGADRKAR